MPFFNQYPLFVGAFARAWPQCGDISFFVGAAVTTIAYLALTAPRHATESADLQSHLSSNIRL